MQDWIDFGVIWGLLILNALVGFFQEFAAGNIVDGLKKNLALRVIVVRNATRVEIPAKEVVPGDIIFLEDVSFNGEENTSKLNADFLKGCNCSRRRYHRFRKCPSPS